MTVRSTVYNYVRMLKEYCAFVKMLFTIDFRISFSKFRDEQFTYVKYEM